MRDADPRGAEQIVKFSPIIATISYKGPSPAPDGSGPGPLDWSEVFIMFNSSCYTRARAFLALSRDVICHYITDELFDCQQKFKEAKP